MRWHVAPPAQQPRPEPGSWRACPHCGATGTRPGAHYWNGSELFTDTEESCGTCRAAGWLPAPAHYALPVSAWPRTRDV